MNTNIEQAICDSIDILVKKRLAEADFDKTVQANIIECVDKKVGKYSLNYQGAEITAYAANAHTYQKDDLVFVLVSNNNPESRKIILGFAYDTELKTVDFGDNLKEYIEEYLSSGEFADLVKQWITNGIEIFKNTELGDIIYNDFTEFVETPAFDDLVKEKADEYIRQGNLDDYLEQIIGKPIEYKAGDNINISEDYVISTPSNTVSRRLSQAEYDALSEEEQNDGTYYYIYDSEGEPDITSVNYASLVYNAETGNVELKNKYIIDQEASKILPFKFGIDENGNYGYYKDGADTVTPFKSGSSGLPYTETAAKLSSTAYDLYDSECITQAIAKLISSVEIIDG